MVSNETSKEINKTNQEMAKAFKKITHGMCNQYLLASNMKIVPIHMDGVRKEKMGEEYIRN